MLFCCPKAVCKKTDLVVDNIGNRGRSQCENGGDLHGRWRENKKEYEDCSGKVQCSNGLLVRFAREACCVQRTLPSRDVARRHPRMRRVTRHFIIHTASIQHHARVCIGISFPCATLSSISDSIYCTIIVAGCSTRLQKTFVPGPLTNPMFLWPNSFSSLLYH